MTVRAQGTKIGGYTLQERLAVGGMGEVFLARAPGGAQVVLKLLADKNRADPAWRELMRREGALGRATAHPNVVAVLDAGDNDADPFIVLEYVDGVDLWRVQRALQHTMRRMEAPLACHVVRELLAGIAHIHGLRGPDGHGLIHRDVSPSNVFLSLAGDVKLGDLGIALQARPSAPSSPGSVPGARLEPVMVTGAHRGKLGYMAAEQLLGQAVDHRVDLFAAGVVLAEVLTGRSLFTPGSDMGRTLGTRDAEVEALIDVLADHSPSLVSVVLRALARSPAERFQTADEFRAALAPHAGDPAEARPLLAALVAWARNAGRAIARSPGPPSDEATTKRRASVPSDPSSFYGVAPDPEVTREVPLVFYEVIPESGAPRGRYTWARLIEMAFQGALAAGDVVQGPDAVPRRVSEVPELASLLAQKTATTSEVAAATADWADALPGCTFLHGLARLVFAEESGVLVAEAANVRREVYLHRGRPTHVASSLAGEGVGEYLLQQRALTRGELDMVFAMLPRFEGRVQRAVVQLGILDESRLAGLVDALARERLLDLFRWQRGTLRFFRAVPPPSSALPVNAEPYELLRQGAQLLEDLADYFTPLLDRPVVAAASVRGLGRLSVGAIGHDLLARADGTTSLRTIAQRVATDRRAPTSEVYRSLYFLLEIGALELR
ncbi:MAG: serine/threonine-protein kinase [Polyangiales bacterium]